MVRVVDCHCHLEDAEFDSDRDQVISRALEKNVIMITSGLGLEDAQKSLQISGKYPNIYCTVGFAPYSDGPIEPIVEFIKQNHKKLVGIGEVGLDFYWQKEESQHNTQIERFERFIELSKQLDLPLVIHSRSAGKYAIELLSKHGVRRVMMHAFDGKVGHALDGAELGYYFSIPPSVVGSAQKQKLVAALPLDNLLLETDAPVLGPDRNTRNEPANVHISAEKIAEIKSVDVEQVLELTFNNAKELFRLKV